MSQKGESSQKRAFGHSFSPEQQDLQTKKLSRQHISDKMGTNEGEVTNAQILEVIKLSSTNTETKLIAIQKEFADFNKTLTTRIESNESSIFKNSRLILANSNEISRIRVSKEIVITGIPIEKNENVTKMFTEICKALGYSDDAPSVYVRRLTVNKAKSQPSTNSSSFTPNKKSLSPSLPIFVEFSFFGEKKQFMDRYFKFGGLNLTSIGFQNASRIYVNDRMTRRDMEIKRTALALKKDGKLHSVFVTDGRVYVRVEKSSEQVHIDSLEQLALK